MLQSRSTARASSKSQVILSSAEVRLMILTMGLASLPGCDPVRTIRHGVRMAVVDDHGVPAPDVKVSTKESWESWQTWGGGTAESEKSYFHAQWVNEPWLKGVTNAEGEAVIVVEITALDWTKGTDPPASRDVVSNREYIIQLERQGVQDEIRILMKPGAVVTGKQYTVRIEAIEKPKFVPTN